MNTILAVWNGGSRGKSTTLRKFADHLLHSFSEYKTIYEDRYFKKEADFTLVVKIGRRIIGITSKGDPGTNLEGRLKELIDAHKCNLILCTTRTSGETVDAVMRHKKSYEIIWTSTYETENKNYHSVFNQKKAEHIFDILHGLGVF